ncbi:Autophagy-related protein 17 [Cercospora zeina]
MSSDSSSVELSASPSLSPPHSPVVRHLPGLQDLVVHFVDAKKSLSATSHVYRANELVTNSRALIEEIAILSAKNTYARRGLDEQVSTLDAIREALVDDETKISDEFDVTIADLDKAHARLDKTLSQLRKTIVAERHSLSRRRTNDTVTDAPEKPDEDETKTLFDFIDEDTHENLLSTLRNLIDQYNDARGDLNDNLSNLEDSVNAIKDKLSETAAGASTLKPDKPIIYDDAPPSIPSIFQGMEEHATEMAGLLENLVNHYDLCVSALKHTEGGGEAARQATADMKEATPGTEESLYDKTVAEPISDEERAEMLQVLLKDSQEVDDVVAEVRDRANEMEDQYSLLTKYAKKARAQNQALQQVLETMREIRAAIPGHLDAAGHFREQWQSISVDIRVKTQELSELSVFYEQFLAGYRKLLREVERRKVNELAMKKIVEKARKDLDRLHETDRLARKEFMEDVGAYLPRDLGVWHGLDEDSLRWDVRPVYDDRSLGGEEAGRQASPRLLDGS